MYYPCSENKGADQLRGYREADLRLCFRLCRLLVFPCTGLFNNMTLSLKLFSYQRRPWQLSRFLIMEKRLNSMVYWSSHATKKELMLPL